MIKKVNEQDKKIDLIIGNINKGYEQLERIEKALAEVRDKKGWILYFQNYQENDQAIENGS